MIGSLTAGNATMNIAQCTSTGFRPGNVSLSWRIEGGVVEPVLNPLVFNTANNKFEVTSYYRRAVTKADNGKTLTCSVSHAATQTVSLTGNVALNVLCKFYLLNCNAEYLATVCIVSKLYHLITNILYSINKICGTYCLK